MLLSRFLVLLPCLFALITSKPIYHVQSTVTPTRPSKLSKYLYILSPFALSAGVATAAVALLRHQHLGDRTTPLEPEPTVDDLQYAAAFPDVRLEAFNEENDLWSILWNNLQLVVFLVFCLLVVVIYGCLIAEEQAVESKELSSSSELKSSVESEESEGDSTELTPSSTATWTTRTEGDDSSRTSRVDNPSSTSLSSRPTPTSSLVIE